MKYLVPPEEIPALFEAVFERAQVHVKKRRDSALHTSILLSDLLLFIWFTLHGVALILLLALVALGVIPLAESMTEQHRVHTYSAQQMACEVPEARFRAWLSTFLSPRCSPWTWGLGACIGVIYVLETFLGKTQSIAAAGLVKEAVWRGETWRVLTSTRRRNASDCSRWQVASAQCLGQQQSAPGVEVRVDRQCHRLSCATLPLATVQGSK